VLWHCGFSRGLYYALVLKGSLGGYYYTLVLFFIGGGFSATKLE
jgi:hypothetical protein